MNTTKTKWIIWGIIWNAHKLETPDIIKNSVSDKLIIAMAQWRQVYKYAIEQYEIQPEKIDNHYFIQREDLLKYYRDKTKNSGFPRKSLYLHLSWGRSL